MTKSKNKNKKVKLSGRNESGASESSSDISNSSVNPNHHNNINKHNTHLSEAISSSTPKMASMASVNRFEALYEDAGDVSFNTSRRSLPPLPGEFPMPAIPDIPNVDKLNETQRKFILITMADKLRITPTTEPPTPPTNLEASTSAAPTPAAPTPSAPTPATSTPVASTPAAKTALNGRQRSQSRKRKRAPDAEAVDPPPSKKTLGSDGVKAESVFLTGVKEELRKNGIDFQREFSKAVPNIKLEQATFTRSGCVILRPASPEDFSKLMKEDWSKHVSLGNSISASLPKSKKLEYKVVVTGVDPDLDDD